MAKLYYTSTSCGAASFISAYHAGISLQTEQVDIREHKTASGADFYTINPKGNVPTLVLADGTVISENVATLLWVADQAPGKLAPKAGSSAYYSLIHALSFTATELHQSVAPLFNPALPAEVQTFTREKYAKKLQFLNDSILAGGKKFIVGSEFTVADAYTGIVLSWSPYVKIDLSPYPNVEAYYKAFEALPQVSESRAKMATSPKSTV